MSIVKVKKVIQKMRSQLNSLIANSDFDLQDSDILEYSKRLDKAIISYNKKALEGSDCNHPLIEVQKSESQPLVPVK